MSKVLILGVDGLDPVLIRQWIDSLPNLRSIINDTMEISIDSTFPPDSICAWTSIFTGTNPAEHGLIESIDYLSGKKDMNTPDTTTTFKGKTFWDIASNEGKKVCVINPFLAYPAWNVNGVMVSGPVFESGSLSAFPETFSTEYEFPSLGGIVDFPNEKDLNDFIKQTEKATQQLSAVSLKIFQDQSPDLFFVTFLTLDRIKHFLWRFTDREDPSFESDNIFCNVVQDFYILFDTIIGQFKSLLSKDYTLLIISDHGHRKRCRYVLNVNELLRKEGFLHTNDYGTKGRLNKLIEKMKVLTLSSLEKYSLQDYIYKIAKLIPYRKALKSSSYLIDRDNSLVTLSNWCGTNPYGGIDINIPDKKEFEQIREKIIKELMHLNSVTEKNIVKWAKKRELLYRGKFENRLPDIFFELDEDYGIGKDFYTPLITNNYTYKKISGGHKREAVLLIHNDTIKTKTIPRPDSIIGLKDFILNLMETS